MSMSEDDTYRVSDAHAGREVSPFFDYLEKGDDDSRPYLEPNCPECEHSIPVDMVALEGGCRCPGCRRPVRLHIVTESLPETPLSEFEQERYA